MTHPHYTTGLPCNCGFTKDLEPSWTFAKLADVSYNNPIHSPNWKPGSRGKGIVFRNGEVHTWNTTHGMIDPYEGEGVIQEEDGYPFHDDYLNNPVNQTPQVKPDQFFQISPHGEVSASDYFMPYIQEAQPELHKKPKVDWNLSKVADMNPWNFSSWNFKTADKLDKFSIKTEWDYNWDKLPEGLAPLLPMHPDRFEQLRPAMEAAKTWGEESEAAGSGAEAMKYDNTRRFVQDTGIAKPRTVLGPHWREGEFGKGIMLDNGDIHSWNVGVAPWEDRSDPDRNPRDGFPGHPDYLNEFEDQLPAKPQIAFSTDPDGSTFATPLKRTIYDNVKGQTVPPEFWDRLKQVHPQTFDERAKQDDSQWAFSSWNLKTAEDQDIMNDRSQWGNLQVRLKSPQYGIMQGKSEEHGAGQYKEIPANSIGTLMEVDPLTGWCSCIFAGPQSTAGPMQPYHISAWLEPKDLTVMPSVQPPGPFVNRRSPV